MQRNGWINGGGSIHGDWCREKFFKVTCKYCKKRVYYWQCSHGCKCYFHKIPSRDGDWDSKCPNRN